MTIHEPATLVTDYLLAALSAWLGSRLRYGTSAPQRWWSLALWLSGAAAAVGGTFHGFGPGLPPAGAQALWRITLLFISLTSAAMGLTLVGALASVQRRVLFAWMVWAKFAAFSTALLVWPVFLVAVTDYGTTMLALAVAAHICAPPWRAAMLAGVGLSALAAIVQQMHWGTSSRLNHNDLYHVIQAAAAFLFFRAGKNLGRQAPE